MKGSILWDMHDAIYDESVKINVPKWLLELHAAGERLKACIKESFLTVPSAI